MASTARRRPDTGLAIRYVALLRAINVGGRVVRMGALRAVFEEMGLQNVATYIASGNVLFESSEPAADLERRIETQLRAALSYEVPTMLRSAAELKRLVEHVLSSGLDPSDGVRLYVGFLKRAPAPARVRTAVALSNETDQLSVQGRELFWRCRTSFGQSSVSGAQLEKVLQVPATIRSFSTVQKLSQRLA